MVEPAFSITRPMARAISHQMASRHGGGDELDGLDPAYWQATAPADSAGDANTMSQLWSGAITSTTFRCSAKLSASAAAVRLVISEQSDMSSGLFYSKEPVASANGHAKPIVQGLVANRTYYWGLLVDGVLKTNSIGRFKTLPNSAAFSFSFTVGGDSNNDSDEAFVQMATHDANLFVHLGDIDYTDTDSTAVADHLTALEPAFAQAGASDYYRNNPTLSVWSNHDYCGTGIGAAAAGKAAAQAAYRAKRPHPALEVADGIYHSAKVGRCVFVMTDSRSFRSDPADPDGPSKTVLGTTQKTWLKALLVDAANNGCMFFLVFPEPWNGTTEDAWSDFATERAELADYIIANGLQYRVLMLSADAHCVAIDGGSHMAGGFPVFHAAPISQSTNTKGIVADIGPFTTSTQQYGLVDVTDDGGDLIEIRLRAFTGAGAGLADQTYYCAPSGPTVVRYNIEQAAAGGVASKVLSITTPDAGNRLLLYVAVDKASGTINTPTDDGTGPWSLVGTKHEAGTGVSAALFTKVAAGDETEITATWANLRGAGVIFAEVANAGAVDAFGISTTQASSVARTTGTITASSATVDEPQLALAFAHTDSASATDTSTAHGWTNGFIEMADLGFGEAAPDSGSPSMAFARKLLPAVATPSTEFTWTGDATDEAMGMLVTVRSA